jgi:broad specificity phosphatase PhoE
MQIYLIRHGQTNGDVENRYGGDYNDHLAGLGMDQAQKVAGQLVNKGIHAYLPVLGIGHKKLRRLLPKS